MHIDDLRHGLVVSCQPVPQGPFDNARSVVRFALAAIAGGAVGLRIESVAYVRAVRAATTLPIIGIVKEDRLDTDIRITPTTEQAAALCEAGADIVAFDATRRKRPVGIEALIATIKGRGRLAMADCSDLEDARAALAAGADFVGTTMSGYTGGAVPVAPDLALVAAISKLTPHVVAEGRFNTPELAAEAIRRGAWCVVVGSALTRTEHATAWFRSAVDAAARESAGEQVLAIDIGGTKISAALVARDRVQSLATVPTDQAKGPEAWLATIRDRFDPAGEGTYGRVGLAVSGLVRDGRWSSLNPATLRLPDRFELVATAERLFGVPAVAANDAQAAAWGEHRWGAGEGEDMVFLTISTGVGGGVVAHGRLLEGLAGHFGQWRVAGYDGPMEDEISGRWMAAQARAAGVEATAQGVFEAAGQGQDWAADIVRASAAKVARLCANIQLAIDPRRIVIGGGIGLAGGFLERVRGELEQVPAPIRPVVVAARLGANAGLVGIADLARR